MSKYTQEDRNMIMACYTVSLCNDQTLRNERIRSGTVNEYLKAAARLSAPREKLDPTKNAFGQKSTFIKAILDEHKRWEKMPNRREPLTPNMVYAFASTIQSEHIDSKNKALYDWLVLALYLGPRKSEWCQDKVELGKTKTIAKNIDGTSKAFTFNDFEFRGPNGSRLGKYPQWNNIESVRITRRFQKKW